MLHLSAMKSQRVAHEQFYEYLIGRAASSVGGKCKHGLRDPTRAAFQRLRCKPVIWRRGSQMAQAVVSKGQEFSLASTRSCLPRVILHTHIHAPDIKLRWFWFWKYFISHDAVEATGACTQLDPTTPSRKTLHNAKGL